MGERGVCGVALAGLDLEAGLDDVAGGGEVSGGHTGDGAGGEELEDAELLGGGLAEVVALEMVVGWEVDGGEGNVAEETRGCTLVETHQTEVLDNPHRRATRDAFERLCCLSLDLKTDLDDLEGVGEDLNILIS